MHSIEQMLSDYPFLSFVKYSHTDYIGVIQNHDGDIVSVYAFNKLRTDEDKKQFLEQAETWWWESNRMIPINIFLKDSWKQFSYTLVTLSTKDVKELQGHVVSLAGLANKRTKRKVVQLVRRLG
jgi:iron uptake system EfeUOB component EfeO/EfeM